MRTMCIFCLLLFAVVGAAQATSSSTNHKGSIDYNGVKDRYDCIHLGGVWHPLAASLHKDSLISSSLPCVANSRLRNIAGR